MSFPIPSPIKNLFGLDVKAEEIRGVSLDKKGNVIINVKVSGKKDSIVTVSFPINLGTSAIPYLKGLSKVAKEKYLKENYFYTRADLLQPIAESQVTPKKYDDILSRLKPQLIKPRPKDIGCLRYAAIICNREDSGATEKELETYRGELYHVHHSTRGYTLYNWMRCGEVFEQEIFPFLNLCVTMSDKRDDFEKLFLPFWDGRINFHPNKIFVSRNMSTLDLQFNIKLRLIDNKQEEVRIYTRSSRIEFAKKAIEDFKMKMKDCTINVKEIPYKYGTCACKTYILKLA